MSGRSHSGRDQAPRTDFCRLQELDAVLSEDVERRTINMGGLRTVDLGHGRSKPAETVRLGDKMGMAAQANDLVKVQRLIKRGVSVNARNSTSGVTPLGVAAERGHDDMVKVLLGARANLDDTTREGMTPLHICCQFGRADTVRLLAAAGANVNSVARNLPPGHEQTSSTPLMSAAGRLSVPTVKALLEARADVNFRPRPARGCTALHLACRLGALDVLQALLDSGCANTGIRNREGEPPRDAPRDGDRVELLAPAPQVRAAAARARGGGRAAPALRQVRQVHRRGDGAAGGGGGVKQGRPRRQRGGWRRGSQAGASVGAGDCALPSELLSAYMRAGSALGDVGMIKNLAAAPTSLACAQPDLVNVPDATGRTALHAACENGHVGIAAALLGNGAYVDAQRKDGQTPLHVVCAGGHPLLVQLLLRHGASQSIPDEAGKVARDVATPEAAAALPPSLPELGIL
ncbi:hypothetical protein EMIHUDRAFT_422274 [Emiliania huxleyi CCMP1516]|uniref:Uncharacterized protein n=2 Tax=Emiliania huxleyi TaxID=2903 RepID=A0A0D3II04_EMIH1|nr:hypothetical protein EMIHUDRAFT_422274 [Emiliania huxleyi CCMP1516]EOD10889.1 hypothetical protein EMIHUDRAFT_422274 [Emiliania huxleyi CCMP1516]|eukprot:XP_005763318.1 hypothetical protein EMIHUDRAFT_422274 [Emiliania huxleyi CCMP1516]